MACVLKAGFYLYGSCDKTQVSFMGFPSIGSLDYAESKLQEFMGKSPVIHRKSLSSLNIRNPISVVVNAQTSICTSKSMRWWKKALKPNMIEIQSAQELVDSLSNAGDRLVIIDFYSPGCGGCKALHPKICQLAESNPNAIFLKVNYEELKAMCQCLHIHVLPFFRFYRGSAGRLCSFSCTNVTIKKFKDALTKFGADGYSLGPAKGLDESELSALAQAGQISRNILPEITEDKKIEELVLHEMILSNAFGKDENMIGISEGGSVLMA